MNEPSKEEVLDVLQKAREVVDDDRFWTAGAFKRCGTEGTVGVCALGAIALVMPREMPLANYREDSREVQLYAKHLRPQGPSVPQFNDSCKSNAPVVAMFDEAINRLLGEVVPKLPEGDVKTPLDGVEIPALPAPMATQEESLESPAKAKA